MHTTSHSKSFMSKTIHQTPWHEVYHKLALELHKFYKIHRNRAGQKLFELLNQSTLYKNQNFWLSNIRRIKKPSLEPIQLFVSFSRSGQADSTRVTIINEVWSLLSRGKRRWTEINFDGCPTPMALKLQYVRPEIVQSKIWETFDDLMTKGKQALNSKLWYEAKSWRGIEIPSFTIFLFWIKNTDFLPLDKNTRSYLVYRKLLRIDYKVDFQTYRSLVDDERIGNYLDLALDAYYYNNEPDLFKKKFADKPFNTNAASASFRIIGFRILKRNSEVHKILQANTYYPVDNSLQPSIESKKENFEILRDSTDTLYNLKFLKLNVTAIVGKNGSGKSSLLDLLLMGIHNLSIQLRYLESELLPDLNFEVYWQNGTLYKLRFEKNILFYEFTSTPDNTYQLVDKPIPLEQIKNRFFYGILINYSHYALNSNDYLKDWITPLSHKNDGYKTPLVIAPKRIEGNIDINSEKELLNQRLLQNFLELHDSNLKSQSFRCIDYEKFVSSFVVTFNWNKAKEKRVKLMELIGNNSMIVPIIINILKQKYRLFALASIKFHEELVDYLIYKLITICYRYDEYRKKFENRLRKLMSFTSSNSKIELSNLVSDILEQIDDDPTHVTTKFKQALNYLRYNTIQKTIQTSISNNTRIGLDKYEKEVFDILNRQKKEERTLLFAELLPPSLFKFEFFLDDKDNSSLNRSSSGEFQLLGVLSNLLYHIRNVDSLGIESRYDNLVVILDEIELYFHPNLQRRFIKKMMDALAKLRVEVNAIHVMFSTHSPFILSDIKQNKVLKLKSGLVKETTNSFNTFASNIHDLLADEFFLENGYMGAFAKTQIEILIHLLNYFKATQELKDPTLKKLPRTQHSFIKRKLQAQISQYGEPISLFIDFDISKKINDDDLRRIQRRIRNRIDLIGEPIIRENLEILYRAAFNRNLSDSEISRVDAQKSIRQLMRDNDLKIEDIL